MMVGDDSERPATEELARALGVDADVRFVGKQEQMEEILAVSDIFLLPSDYESFGLAALEAMAARAIVISSNAGVCQKLTYMAQQVLWLMLAM
jgi:glycosyltransferase involved in cell wall biosynthesis